MAQKSEGQPSLDIENVDLDAGLTEEERAIIAGTPFYSLAKVFSFFCLAALAIIVVSCYVQDVQRQGARVDELRERIETGSRRVEMTTPGEWTELAWDWFALRRRINDEDFSLKQRESLASDMSSYGRLLLDRGATHLKASEYLDFMEVAMVASVMKMMIDTIGPASNPEKYQPLLDRAVKTVTDGAVRMAGPGATVRDLRRAAGLLYRLADVVEPHMRVEYTTAAASLQDRARLIDDRSRAATDVGGIDASVRSQFAATLAPLLQSADDAVLRVSVDGPDAQILVVEGRGSPTHLAELVVESDAVLERLRVLSFTTLRAVGTAGTIDVDLRTLDMRRRSHR